MSSAWVKWVLQTMAEWVRAPSSTRCTMSHWEPGTNGCTRASSTASASQTTPGLSRSAQVPRGVVMCWRSGVRLRESGFGLGRRRGTGDVTCDPEEEPGMEHHEWRPQEPPVGKRPTDHGGEDDGGVRDDHAHGEAEEQGVHHQVVGSGAAGRPEDQPSEPAHTEPGIATEHRRGAEAREAARAHHPSGDVTGREPHHQGEEHQAGEPGPDPGCEQRGGRGHGIPQGKPDQHPSGVVR